MSTSQDFLEEFLEIGISNVSNIVALILALAFEPCEFFSYEKVNDNSWLSHYLEIYLYGNIRVFR
jgi:hypothetical protein